MSHRMIAIFRSDSKLFDLTSEQLERALGKQRILGALPTIKRMADVQTSLQWRTPDTEHGFQYVALSPGAVVLEGDQEHVAELVVLIRGLFPAEADDIWVGNPGLVVGRPLLANCPASEVLEGWTDLPIDTFR